MSGTLGRLASAAVLVRTAAFALAALLVAVALVVPHPAGSVPVAQAALLAAALAALLPRTAAPAVALVLLAALYAVLTDDLAAGTRAAAAVVAAGVLWLLHALHALAAAVPLAVQVDPSVWQRWVQRLGEVLAPALPLAALVAAAGALAPAARPLGLLGLLAAVLLVAGAGRLRS